MPEVAIVAALEREVWPLVRHWRASHREYSGRRFRFFESEQRVVVCGGMGPEAARRATEAVICLYRPSTVLSVGFAGALDPTLRVGDVLQARYVVDALDGSKTDTGSGAGVLVSFSSVAGKEQKAKLAKAYRAQAVDMEAAAVAKGAEARGLRFAVIKTISDEAGFAMAPMERFIREDGGFDARGFAVFAALRPWHWWSVLRLARDSSKASRHLCEFLNKNAEWATQVPAKVGP